MCPLTRRHLDSQSLGVVNDDKFHPLLCLFFFFFLIWLHWVFVAARGLSLVAASGGYSSLWCAGSRSSGSVVAACGLSSSGTRALERTGFSSCGSLTGSRAQAQ